MYSETVGRSSPPKKIVGDQEIGPRNTITAEIFEKVNFLSLTPVMKSTEKVIQQHGRKQRSALWNHYG